MVDEHCADDNVYFKYYVVLFVDILGQSEAVKRLASLPTNAEQRTEYIRTAKQSVGKVEGVRQSIIDYVGSFLSERPQPQFERLNSEQRAQYKRFRECKIGIQVFSDTIVAYSPLVSSDGGEQNVSGVYALLNAACSVMLHCLASKCAIRGAIEVGVAMELRPHDLYGPAFAQAYSLENKVADYPRIVVGKGLLEHIEQLGCCQAPDSLSRLNAKMAKYCREMVCQDTDGVQFVDYLGSPFMARASKAMDVDLVQKCFEFANKEYGEFLKNGDQKHALRYCRLVQYITAHMKRESQRPGA